MRILFAILFFCSFALTVFSQRTWIETDISKEIVKNLELSVSPQVRFREDFELKEYFFDTNIEYKLHKYLRIGGGFRLGNIINKKNETESFGRFNIDAKLNYKWKRFEPKFRLRYTNADDFDEEVTNSADFFRYKIGLEYSIKKLKLKPYILNEWYRDIEEKEFSKSRFESGVLYKLSKQHRVGMYYRTNNYLITDKETINIIGILYKLKL